MGLRSNSIKRPVKLRVRQSEAMHLAGKVMRHAKKVRKVKRSKKGSK